MHFQQVCNCTVRHAQRYIANKGRILATDQGGVKLQSGELTAGKQEVKNMSRAFHDDTKRSTDKH
jgi:hypothetical protein